MLNRALRLMEVDLIIKMGFFVRDLHNHIAALHSDQYSENHRSESFIVYCSQGLSQTDFDQLMKTRGGLLAFNNLLSTSINRDISLRFARRINHTSNLMGVLFVMKIDPSITATPFANVENIGYYPGENEILFSMHSVFRIGQVEQIDKKHCLWQVDLTLASDNDPQLHNLTQLMREETSSGYERWYRLGKLMIRLGHFNKAKELSKILLAKTTDETGKRCLYQMLGQAKYLQGEYAKTITFYEKAPEIRQKALLANHPNLATSYNNIGLV